jgi:hypothetical protein
VCCSGAGGPEGVWKLLLWRLFVHPPPRNLTPGAAVRACCCLRVRLMDFALLLFSPFHRLPRPEHVQEE